jgi:hypothetical protein
MTAIHNGQVDVLFLARVALGEVKGHASVFKFGHNANATTTLSEIWEGGAYPWPTSAAQLTVSSSSAEDASGGTGVYQVYIEGLDDDYLEISETITIAGQTPVTMVNSYYRVFRMWVTGTPGSNGTNVGDIYIGTGTVTAGVPATYYAKISADEGQTQMLVYTVPAGKSAVIMYAQVSPDSSKGLQVSLFLRLVGEPWRIGGHAHAYNFPATEDLTLPIVAPAKTDIAIKAALDVGTAQVAGHMGILLVDN